MQFLSEYTGRSVSDGWKNIPDAYQWKLKFGNQYVLSVINNGMALNKVSTKSLYGKLVPET